MTEGVTSEMSLKTGKVSRVGRAPTWLGGSVTAVSGGWLGGRGRSGDVVCALGNIVCECWKKSAGPGLSFSCIAL